MIGRFMLAVAFVLAVLVAGGCVSRCEASLLQGCDGGRQMGGAMVPSEISPAPYDVCQSLKPRGIFFSGKSGMSAESRPSLLDPAGFREYWSSRSIYLGFSQVWTTPAELAKAFPDGPPQDRHPYPGWIGTVDFAQVADVAEVQALSVRAESEYLLLIDVFRAEFIAENCGKDSSAANRARWSLEFERELCKADLFWLAKHVLGYEDMSFHLHYFMTRLVNEVPADSQHLFEFPRDSFKSTIFGIAKTVQWILNDPNITILYLSGSLDNAKKKTAEIRNQFTKNEVLLHLFPEFRAPKSAQGSEGEWSAPCRTTFQGEPTVKANGITSKLASKHVDIIICDDIWDEKSVTTPDIMRKTRKAFGNVAFLFKRTSLKVMLVIGTRFAQDDLTLDIAGDGTKKHPGMRLFDGNCHIVSGVLRNGRSLFPEGFSLDWMMDYCNGNVTKDSDDEEGGLYAFSCQIMLNPTMADRGMDENWFRVLRFEDIQQAANMGLLSYDVVLLSDAAGSDNKGSDRDAILVVVRDSMGRKTVVKSECRNRAPAAFVSRVFALADLYRAKGLVLQKAAIDTVVRSFIDEENVKRAARHEPVLPVIPYSLQRQDKDERITHALQPLLQRGELYFDPDMEEHDDLVRELRNHPASLEKHRIDALSELGDPAIRQCPTFRSEPPPPPPYKPETVDEVEDMQREFRRQQMARVLERAEYEGDDWEDRAA